MNGYSANRAQSYKNIMALIILNFWLFIILQTNVILKLFKLIFIKQKP